jgi:5,10-methylenetetrahydromethanopterin reductase
VLGIGRGDSALAYVGHAPVHIEVFKRYIEAVQTYLRGEAVSFDDLTYWQQMAPRVETLQLSGTPEDSRLVWLTPEDEKVPVEAVATGPKAIAAASRHADHVMFALGADTERVKWGLEKARSARREVGLDPNGIKFGAYLNVVCHPHLDVARDLLSELDTFARFSAMHGKTFGPVSRREQEVLTGIRQSYDMFDDGSDHFRPPVEFVDRFAIVGPPDTCIERIEELADLGIEKVVVIGPTVGEQTGEAARASELMAREVLPAFSG